MLAIVALLGVLALASHSIVSCNRNQGDHDAYDVDIAQLAEKVEFLMNTDTVYLGRLDTLQMASIKHSQRVNALMFDVNRAIHYISQEVGIEPDSVWQYVISQRKLREAKAAEEAAKAGAD